MKNLHLFLLLSGILFFAIDMNAQNSQYVTAMKENLEKLAKWSDSPQALTASFERIAQAEKTKWLPYYYAAYTAIIQSFSLQKPELQDKMLGQAQGYLDAAGKLNPDSSELEVLQGFIYVARLQVDPQNRGAEYSQKASGSFDKAIGLNPDNPRGYYMKGITVLHTPDFYGGGKGPAKPILKQAVGKFESFTPSSPFSPIWGKEDCQKQLASCE